MFDLNDEKLLTGNRHAIYAKLRTETPVLEMPPEDGSPTWLFSRFQDIHALMRIPNARVHPLDQDAPPWMPDGPALKRLHGNLSQTDAPLHTRLRSALGSMFIPRKIEALREISADSVARALKAMADKSGDFDAVHDIAAQIPKGVLCRMLGIPESDWQKLIAVQFDFLQIFSMVPLSPAQQARLDEVTEFYLDYFDNILNNTDPAKRTPLIELLLENEAQGILSRVESLSIMHTVLDAGYETTRTSISNVIEFLATKPGLLDQIRADPTIINAAVEELLRYESPVHLRFRYLVDPYTASDGTVIPSGAKVLMLIACANQDEAMFPNPLQIDFGRSNAAQHMAFGAGMHHCLGSPIARIQLQEALRGLASTYKKFELPDGPGPRFPMLVFPALSSLRVKATR